MKKSNQSEIFFSKIFKILYSFMNFFKNLALIQTFSFHTVSLFVCFLQNKSSPTLFPENFSLKRYTDLQEANGKKKYQHIIVSVEYFSSCLKYFLSRSTPYQFITLHYGHVTLQIAIIEYLKYRYVNTLCTIQYVNYEIIS